MSADLANILILCVSGLASTLMLMILGMLRDLRKQQGEMATKIAYIEGRLSARREGDWQGEERRRDAD